MKPVHISTNRFLSRRTFLRGVGVSLGLPMLGAMRPAFGAPAPVVKRRMVTICTSFGIHAQHLFPAQTGRGYGPTLYSKIIDEFRDQYTLFSGLSHPEVDGAHSSDNSFLTAAPHPGASDFRNSISLDQLALEHLPQETRYRSLVLSSMYDSSLSWTRSGAMIPADSRPYRVFARLFLEGSPGDIEQQVQRLREGQSIMDTISGKAKSLDRKLGAQDREKLDQYFTSVRELEQRLVQTEEWTKKPKPTVSMKPPADPSSNADVIGVVRPMLDLIHLALQTDSTRIATLRINGMNEVPVIEGVTRDWHNLSHHGKDPGKIKELSLIEQAQLQELHGFLKKLHSSPEDESSLLDRTMVLYGSPLGNASSHDTRNMPVILAGGGFRHGQHLAFDRENNTPLCNLYVQMLQQLGVETDAFASSKGTIPGFEAI